MKKLTRAYLNEIASSSIYRRELTIIAKPACQHRRRLFSAFRRGGNAVIGMAERMITPDKVCVASMPQRQLNVVTAIKSRRHRLKSRKYHLGSSRGVKRGYSSPSRERMLRPHKRALAKRGAQQMARNSTKRPIAYGDVIADGEHRLLEADQRSTCLEADRRKL